jgi:Cysteine dioxygenase type I
MGPDRVTAYAGETTTDNPLHAAHSQLSPSELVGILEVFASKSSEWIGRVRLCAHHRRYERVYRGPHHDIWIISWLPGQSTGFHDHGNSAGAFMVATGFLEEQRPGESAHALGVGHVRAFGPNYAHDVRNISLAPAVSIHAYSPPLEEMDEYQWEDDRLIPLASAAGNEAIVQKWSIEAVRKDQLTIEQILSAARARLCRLSPRAAYEESAKGAALVDIRPVSQRTREGSIPGTQVVERNVLEWRLIQTRLPNCSSRPITTCG